MLLPKMFFIYVAELSQDLAMCKSECYIEDQCINYVMYAYDICLPAPIDIGLQRMLDVCFDFSTINHIKFNPIKSVCVVLNLRNSKLYCSDVRPDCDI